jgi:hypothetical protein
VQYKVTYSHQGFWCRAMCSSTVLEHGPWTPQEAAHVLRYILCGAGTEIVHWVISCVDAFAQCGCYVHFASTGRSTNRTHPCQVCCTCSFEIATEIVVYTLKCISLIQHKIHLDTICTCQGVTWSVYTSITAFFLSGAVWMYHARRKM